MADPSNGQMTVYSNDMKSYGMRNGIAEFLGMPREQVRVVWMEGPQGFGRTAADDAGFEAAFLAKEIGRPVRVQWMRQEETAGYQGPVYIKMRGGWMPRATHRIDYDAKPPTTITSYNEPIRADRSAHGNAPHAGLAARPAFDIVRIPNKRTVARW
jgi:CO/xanthine dehydrogenase Mo-binding subunit